MSKETRSLEFSVTIEATPEEIWRAITEGDSITRWFAPEARVTPGLGGSVFLSWGPGMEGQAPITAWEPGRRFAWTERAETDSPRVVEFMIEAADGGITVLRLVQSGFGMDASCDGEYDSTSGGWQSYLALLRRDLEAHRYQSGKHVCRLRMVNGEREALMESLLAAIRFQREGDLYSAQIADGNEIEGRVLFERVPGYLTLALDGAISGALALFAENCGGRMMLTASWYLKGEAAKQAGAIGAGWDDLLNATYPVQSD